MFELDQRIAEQLSTISLNSSVQVRCGNSNAFMVTASTMLPLMQMFEMGGVYITASRGAVEIIQAFESIGVDVSNIQLLCRKCNRSKSNSCYCKIHNKKVGVNCCKENTTKKSVISAKQCSGTTKKGARCKNRTKNTNGRCHHHQ